MNFNDITAEAKVEYGVVFWERYDRLGRVDGYTVERQSDGLKASMLRDQGRNWKGAFGSERTVGTKAKVANWALDQVANADK